MTDLNATSAALLGLLHDGPATGGQLVAAAHRTYGPFFSITRSQVYRELPGLADAGLVRRGEQGPRSSQQFVITTEGKQAFRSWVNAPSGPDHLRSTTLLRVANAGAARKKQRTALIEEARARYGTELDDAKAAAKAADTPFAKAVAQFAQAQAKAALKLVDAVADD